MSEKVVLFARLKVRDDGLDAVKSAALTLVGASRLEDGCESYDVHQAIDDQTVFCWYETWTTQAALDAHFATDGFKEFFALVEENAAEPPVITLTRKLS
jgi:quinol monooxygenase YgiN